MGWFWWCGRRENKLTLRTWLNKKRGIFVENHTDWIWSSKRWGIHYSKSGSSIWLSYHIISFHISWFVKQSNIKEGRKRKKENSSHTWNANFKRYLQLNINWFCESQTPSLARQLALHPIKFYRISTSNSRLVRFASNNCFSNH